jgi:MFS family permease
MADTAPASTAQPIAEQAIDVRRASPFAPFRHRMFLAIWCSNMLSNFGGQMQTVGAAWLMTSLTTRADLVALVQTAASLPILCFSLLAGAVADALPKRNVLLTAQFAMLLCSAILALLTYAGWVTPGSLILCTFLLGAGRAFNAPAWQASVGELVPRDDLAGAVALNSVGFNSARTVGPAAGGVLIAVAGIAANFLFNALSYLGLIGVLLRWRPNYAERTLQPEGLGPAIASGVRYALLAPVIRAVLIRIVCFNAAGAVFFALIPVVARQMLGGGSITYGVLLGSFGIGAVCGALANAPLRAKLDYERMMVLVALVTASGALVVGWSHSMPLSMVAMWFAGAFWTLGQSTYNITMQMAAPRWVVGRAISLFQMSAFGGMALGSYAWGLVARQGGVTTAFSGAAMVLALLPLLALAFRLSHQVGSGLEPAEWGVPETTLALDPKSGPIVLMIEYRIRPEDSIAFQQAMAEKRRIRRRDGARSWKLLQDLDDPEHWVERFQSPSWHAYIHQRSRRTTGDLAIEDKVRALHVGEERPAVRRLVERHPESINRGAPDVIVGEVEA